MDGHEHPLCGRDSEGQEGAQGMLGVGPEINISENGPNAATVFRVPVFGPQTPLLPLFSFTRPALIQMGL